jgi:cytochrome c oxidase cbb3-type subunit 2
VAWPGWFSGAADSRAAGWRAAWLFGVAGWFGSANGIGMAQTLQQVPPAFVAAAGVVVGAVMLISDRSHWRAALAVGCVLLVGWQSGISQSRYVIPAASSAAERGRKVYVSEGCIHCHSQYVRPQSKDPSLWGPPREAGKVLAEEPVLIGNRRQGPDLANIGARRSETWLKLHFIDPRSLIPGSPMPSYAHLFDSGRGDDLVRYLKELGVEHTAELMQRSAAWKPASISTPSKDGVKLFSNHCASCHGAQGRGDGPLAGQLSRPPTNLVNGPFVRSSEPLELARIIKFGIVGSDMAGHETLPDEDVNALVDEVVKLRNR